MHSRDLIVARHEAAHVVVGVALGLRLKRASVAHGDARTRGGFVYYRLGEAEFTANTRLQGRALALMLGAGVAWDKGTGARPWSWRDDANACREYCESRHDYETTLTAAAAILAGRMHVHARVSRALLERDLDLSDIAALCRGETIE